MADDTGAPRRMPRWAKVALTLSLALNALVAAAGVGLVLRGPDLVARAPLVPGIVSFIRALPEEEAKALRADLRGDGRGPRRFVEERRAQRQAMVTALRADPFSLVAVEATLTAERAYVSGLMERGHGALLERIEAMSPEARAAYADRLETRSSKRREDR